MLNCFLLSVSTGHLADHRYIYIYIFLSQIIHRSVFFSCSAVPPHIRSRGLSRLLTFLWPSSYYVGTIRFIPTRFTNVTLTTLLSACVCLYVCVFYGLDLAKSEWCLEANRGIPASEISIILTLAFFFALSDLSNSGVVNFGCKLAQSSLSLSLTHTSTYRRG